MKLEAKVHPNSSRDEVVVNGDKAEIWTKETADRNKANLACIRLLARYFKKPAAKIRLVSGHRSRRKIFLIGD